MKSKIKVRKYASTQVRKYASTQVKAIFAVLLMFLFFVSCQKSQVATIKEKPQGIELSGDDYAVPIVKDKLLFFKTKSDAKNFYRHLSEQMEVAQYSDLADDESAEDRFLSLVEQELGFYSLRKSLHESVQSRTNDEFIGDELEKALLSPDYAVGIGDVIAIIHKEETYEVVVSDDETLQAVYENPVDQKLPLDKFNSNIKLTHSNSGRQVFTGPPNDTTWPPTNVTDRSEIAIEIAPDDLCGGNPFAWHVSIEGDNILSYEINWGDGSANTTSGNFSSGTEYHVFVMNSGEPTILVHAESANEEKDASRLVSLDDACIDAYIYKAITKTLGSWSLKGELWSRANFFGNRCGTEIHSRKNGKRRKRFKKVGIDGKWRFSDKIDICKVDKIDAEYYEEQEIQESGNI